MEVYLPKCLDSLVVDDKDLLQKLDVIVVNDGSKDRTSGIAHEFEAKYPGVFRVIDKQNGHYGSCINAALPVAKGTFVKVLDADDSVETVGFEKLLRTIDEEVGKGDGAADLIVADYVWVNPDGAVIRRPKFGLREDSTSLTDIGNAGGRLGIHSICYRVQNLRRIGYRQTEGLPYTDVEWIIEPMITVRRLRYCQDVVTRYLVGRDGQTMDVNVLSKNFQTILDITKRLVSRFEKNQAICEDNAKAYYGRQVRYLVSYNYSWGLLGVDGTKMSGDMMDFDNFLTQYRVFYEDAETYLYGPKLLPFRYVVSWRKHGDSLYWKARIQSSKLFLLIADKIERFHKCLVRGRVLAWHGFVLGVKGILPGGLYQWGRRVLKGQGE
jgi:glycosyltransferase involved in cell wall biosynthesis